MFLRFSKMTLVGVFATSLCWGGNGVTMEGGGGIEQALLYSWTNLESLVAPCLADPVCFDNANGRRLLAEIASTHAQELSAGGLTFVEIPKSKDVFLTQDYIGAPIQINISALFAMGSGFAAVDALDLLLEALARHHPTLDATGFQLTRSGLISFWSSRIESSDLRRIGHGGVMLMTIADGPLHVLAGDGNGYQDVLQAIEAQLDCFGSGEPKLLALKNFYWLDAQQMDKSTIELPLFGRIRYACQSVDGSTRELSGEFKLSFSALVKLGTAEAFLAAPEKFELDVKIQAPLLWLFDIH